MDNRNIIDVTLRRRGRMKYWNLPENTWWPNAREWGADKQEETHLELEKMQVPTFTRRRRQGVSNSAYPGARQPRVSCRNWLARVKSWDTGAAKEDIYC